MAKESRYECVEDGELLTFGETARARRRAALKRGVFVTVSATVMIVAILIPDFVGRYAESDPTGGLLFLASCAMIGLLLGGALGVSRWVRVERWVLHSGQRELTLRSGIGEKRAREERVSFDEIRELWLKKDALVMILGEEDQEVPLLDGGSEEELAAVASAIEAHLKARRVDLKLRRGE